DSDDAELSMHTHYRAEVRNGVCEMFNKGEAMETREFKLCELEKMILDYVEGNQIGNLRTTASLNSTRTLLKHKTSIAKQLLVMLKNNPHADIRPGQVT